MAALLGFCGEGVAANPETTSPDEGVLSVPAEFVQRLRLPGIGDAIQRPTAVFVDRAHSEVLVADAGRNRVLIFDQEGLFRYEFGFADQVGSVADLAVDASGFIYVLGTAREGRRILRYDFDGIFLDIVSIEGVDPARIESMTVDEQNRIVVIDSRGICTVADATGEVLLRFDTTPDLSDTSALELVRGTPRARNGLLYLPASSLGNVLVFELDSGKARPSVGTKGNTPGQLNFPVAVDLLPSGVLVVLDKMRFNVLCFAPSGRFLGEFGGKGYRDGWMYHPTLIAAVDEDKVLVGQILDQRVQVLRVPDFVFERLSRESVRARRDVADGGSERPVADPQAP